MFHPIWKKSEAGEALNKMIRTNGVPKVSDRAGEEMGAGGCFGKADG
jgi:hypothetical protein